MRIDAATTEDSMEGPQKLKIELPYDPAIPPLGIFPKKTKTLIQKDMHPHVHCSIICKSQDMEAT